MGLLDDAIREHLELKRKHGANPDEVALEEKEALGPGGPRAEFAQTDDYVSEPPALDPEPEFVPEPPARAPEPPVRAPEPAPRPEAHERPPAPAPAPRAPEPDPWLEETAEHHLPPEPRDPADEDVLEETPEFLQETPEHDRLWFEQKPPRDFDWDK